MSRRELAYWALTDALDLLRNAERLGQRVVVIDADQGLPCWTPAVDVYEDGKEIQLVVALPGVDPKAISLALEDGELVVRGERPLPAAFHHGAIHRLEIPYGRFERKITLPRGKFELERDYVEHGCLVLLLRRIDA